MPDSDGISLLSEWREHDGEMCPVVMISGHGSVEAAVEATRLGASDFIEKPVSMARLLNTVRKALAGGRDVRRECAGRRRSFPTFPNRWAVRARLMRCANDWRQSGKQTVTC